MKNEQTFFPCNRSCEECNIKGCYTRNQIFEDNPRPSQDRKSKDVKIFGIKKDYSIVKKVRV